MPRTISLKGQKASATVICSNLIRDGRKVLFLTAYGPSQEIGAFAQLLSDGEASLYLNETCNDENTTDNGTPFIQKTLSSSLPQIIPKIENGYSGLFVLPCLTEPVIIGKSPDECFDIYGRILDQQQFVHRDWYQPMFDMATELLPVIGAKTCFQYAADLTHEVMQRLNSGEFSFPEPTADLTVETMAEKQEREKVERESSDANTTSDIASPDDGKSFWGEVISSYSRAQAIEDGVLVDLSSPRSSLESGKSHPSDLSELCRQLYTYPVACTSGVWGIIERAVSNKNCSNDLRGVVWDILCMSQKGITEKIDDAQHLFQVIITGTGRKRVHTFKAICGPGDDMSPVITIMLPEED
jgi:hypothetical protein